MATRVLTDLGILTVEQQKPTNEQLATTASTPAKTWADVFLSYQSAYMEQVDRIRSELIANDVSCWMAKYDMEGDVWEAMASGIENAKVVLICYSQSYKRSPYCRSEAEYSRWKGKIMIPIKMQKNYDADGWLGIMTITELNYDLSNPDQFDKTFPEILKRIRGCDEKEGYRIKKYQLFH